MSGLGLLRTALDSGQLLRGEAVGEIGFGGFVCWGVFEQTHDGFDYPRVSLLLQKAKSAFF